MQRSDHILIVQLHIHLGLYCNDHFTPKDLLRLPTAAFPVPEILTPAALAKANAWFLQRAAAIGAHVTLGEKSSHLRTIRAIITAARIVHGQRPCYTTAEELQQQRTAQSLETHAWLFASNQGGKEDAVAALALALVVSPAKLFKCRPEKPTANTPLPEHLSLLLVRASVLSLIQTVRRSRCVPDYMGAQHVASPHCLMPRINLRVHSDGHARVRTCGSCSLGVNTCA